MPAGALTATFYLLGIGDITTPIPGSGGHPTISRFSHVIRYRNLFLQRLTFCRCDKKSMTHFVRRQLSALRVIGAAKTSTLLTLHNTTNEHFGTIDSFN